MEEKQKCPWSISKLPGENAATKDPIANNMLLALCAFEITAKIERVENIIEFVMFLRTKSPFPSPPTFPHHQNQVSILKSSQSQRSHAHDSASSRYPFRRQSR